MGESVALTDKLGSHAREGSAGATSYRGFTYQHHWTLCKLLEVHEGLGDYLLLVDHHDDVVIWDRQPHGRLLFFQVKAKARGNWTTANLLARKGGALSILGKLFHHTVLFEGDVERLEFVSNASFSVGRLIDGSDPLDRMVIHCTELESDAAEKIRLALKAEHSLTEDPAFEDLIHLQRSSIPVDAFRDHTLGRVADVLDRQSGGRAVRSKAAYQALMAEIERRAGLVATSFPPDEALRRKSLDRSSVDDMLRTILAPPTQEVWPNIAQGLAVAGYGPVRIARLRRAYGTLSARRTAPQWDFIDDLVERAGGVLMALDDGADLEACLAAALPVLRDQSASLGLEDDELRVIVMEAVFRG